MPTIRDLIDRRAALWTQMQEIRQRVEKEGWTDELRTSWDRADSDLVALGKDIEREESAAATEKRFAEIDHDTIVVGPDGAPSKRADGAYRKAFDRFLRFGLHEMDTEQKQLLRANFGPVGEQRAQGVGTGSAGGYTVPQGFWAKITETMKFFGGMLSTAEIINTTTGNQLPWPTNDDTSNVGALLSENTQITGQDLSFGQKQLNAYTYTSKLILASFQFLQDTAVDAEGFIARKAGQRLGRIYNSHFTTGTGSSQPQGVVTGATTGKTTASATAITYGELVDLQHSVDVAYRNGGARWMMNDLILAYIRKLLDSQNRPLWEPSLQSGVPSTLLGYPVTINNDMDSAVTTGKKTALFGNFELGYVIRQVDGGQLMRLEERYADYLQVGFFAFGRVDGLLQDTSAVKLLVQA